MEIYFNQKKNVVKLNFTRKLNNRRNSTEAKPENLSNNTMNFRKKILTINPNPGLPINL